MTTLVTGGAGYIGSHTVVALAAAGHEVVVVDNLINSSARSLDAVSAITGVETVFHQVDLVDAEAVASVFAAHEIDSVIHFAGLKAVGESVEQPLRYYRNNIDSTLALLDAMGRHDVSKIVFSSSATVYGDPASVPVMEDFPTAPTNPYGQTKLMIEQILTDVSDVSDLNVMLLRYFNPVGAHASGTIGEDPSGIPNNLMPFVMQVAVGRRETLPLFGDDYDTPDGTTIRDYVHVMDLAEGHVAALDALDQGLTGTEIANLGTGVGTSVLEILEAAGAAVGRDIPYEISPRRTGDIERIYAGVGKARDLLGWSASRTIHDMVADHWRWQSSNPNGFGT